MITIGHQLRYAIYDLGKRITEFNWHYYTEDQEYIFLCNDSEVDIYNRNLKSFIAKIPGNLLCYVPDHRVLKIKRDNKYGIYSYDGKEIISVLFDGIEEEEIGLKVKDNNSQYGIYSYDGKELVPILYSHIDCDEYYKVRGKLRLIKVRNEDSFGFFDIKNKIFIEAQDINISKTGIIEVKKNGRWTVLKS